MSFIGGQHDRAELARRLVLTAASLLLYWLGTHIPLPGLDPRALAQLGAAGGAAIERVSILALGVFPLVGVLVLAELAKLVAPQLRRWERADLRNRDRLNRILVGLAIAATVVQGAGYAEALESVARLVEEPGMPFRITCAATLVAGTALVIWLADKITRHGIGSGVWLLFAVPTLADLPYRMGTLADLLGQGTISVMSLVACFAFIVIAVAALAAVTGAGRDTAQNASACLWPTLLSTTALPWLLVAVGLAVSRGDAVSAATWVEPGGGVRLLVLAGLVGLFVHLCGRSNRQADVAASLPVSAMPIWIVLTAIAVTGEVLPARFGLPLPVDAEALVVIALVALVVLARWRQAPPEAAAREEQT